MKLVPALTSKPCTISTLLVSCTPESLAETTAALASTVPTTFALLFEMCGKQPCFHIACAITFLYPAFDRRTIPRSCSTFFLYFPPKLCDLFRIILLFLRSFELFSLGRKIKKIFDKAILSIGFGS